MFYVYILKSKIAEHFYIGHSNDLQRRVFEHNRGKTSSTKHYIPWEIVYVEEFAVRSDAVRREKEIKKFKSGYKFKELLKRRVGRVVECGGLENR